MVPDDSCWRFHFHLWPSKRIDSASAFANDRFSCRQIVGQPVSVACHWARLECLIPASCPCSLFIAPLSTAFICQVVLCQHLSHRPPLGGLISSNSSSSWEGTANRGKAMPTHCHWHTCWALHQPIRWLRVIIEQYFNYFTFKTVACLPVVRWESYIHCFAETMALEFRKMPADTKAQKA